LKKPSRQNPRQILIFSATSDKMLKRSDTSLAFSSPRCAHFTALDWL
jgi:hypothetical protein